MRKLIIIFICMISVYGYSFDATTSTPITFKANYDINMLSIGLKFDASGTSVIPSLGLSLRTYFPIIDIEVDSTYINLLDLGLFFGVGGSLITTDITNPQPSFTIVIGPSIGLLEGFIVISPCYGVFLNSTPTQSFVLMFTSNFIEL